jgi:hypothetical protein
VGVGAKTRQAIFSEAIKDGGRNSVIAGGQTIFENGVAKQTYDLNRSYLENVRERMIAAGITGATLKGGLEIIAKVRMGRNPQTLAETQQILKVKPEIETLTPKQIELKNSGNAMKAKLNEQLETKPNVEQTAKQSALKLEKIDGGHSLDRHGPEISDAKLQRRLTTGIAPDGKFSPTPASTKFNSYEDWMQTRNASLKQIEKIYGVDLSKPPTGNNKDFSIITEYDRAIDDGFVGDAMSKVKVNDSTSPKKKGNGYTKYIAVDGITRTKTTISWDASANRWKVVQHFPLAEG